MMINKTCIACLIAILFLLLASGISFAEDANAIVKNYWYWFLSAAIIFVVMTGFIIEILNPNRRMSASRIRLAEEVSIRE
ncbi:MAG: hypothetical protein KAU60_16560, partial [Desulfobacterales bacterium]|nr:hypothetical protein [Desulfobacterales bacterium]